MTNNRKFTIFLALFAVVFLIAGCTGPNFAFLRKDSLEEDNGLIMVRLRIKDSSHKLLWTKPMFYVQKEGVWPYSISIGSEERKWLGKDRYGYWKQEKDASYFDQYYFIEAKPDRYFFQKVKIEYGSSSYTTTFTSGGTTKHTTINYFDFPLYFTCNLENRGLVAIGTVDITIDEITGKKYPDYRIRYRIGLSQTERDTAAILEKFKTWYPMVSKAYMENKRIGKAFYGFYKGFMRGTEHPRWHSFSSETFTASKYGTYKLSGNFPDKNHGYAGRINKINLPANYIITYKIRWIEGVKDAFYGLRLAQDKKNIYYFGITADGNPVIWIKRNGEWQANPAVKKPTLFMASKKKNDVLSVEVLNNQIIYMINNELVGSFNDVLDLGSAYASFFVSGKQKIEVDSFQITEK